MIKKADDVLFTPMCPGLSGAIGSLADDGLCEPQAVSVPADAFLNIHAGLLANEGVVDEDGKVVDPFGGEVLQAWIQQTAAPLPGINCRHPHVEMKLMKFSVFQRHSTAS
jgi:hypothetical protein